MEMAELRSIVAKLRIQGNDDGAVEVKACSSDLASNIWDSVSAFANTHGGTIVLGLDEHSQFSVVRRFSIDKVISQFVSGIGDGGSGGKLENAPVYTLDRMDFESGQVVVIEVQELDQVRKPCFVKAKGKVGGSYKRVDDKDIKLSPTEIYALETQLTPSEADRSIVREAGIGDLDDAVVSFFIASEQAQGARSLRGASSREEQLSRLNITNAESEVRLAGLLMFGKYPQQFFPKLFVDVTAHPGIEKSSSLDVRFSDRVRCEGRITEMVDDAVRATMKNLFTESIVTGSGRRDRPEIPADVLREAISNALVHREYSAYFQGQSVSVDVYSDRIEITNPGGLWGGKTYETIGDGTSKCRNATLMNLMSTARLPQGGGLPAEGNGSGVVFMQQSMREHGLPEPIFKAGIDQFKVVLLRKGALVGGVGAGLADAVTGGETFANPSDWRTLVLNALDSDVAKSAEQLTLETGRPKSSVRRYLAQLIKEGRVSATAPPTSRNRKYLLV